MEDLEKKKLEQERAELDRLIGKGVTFEVDDVRFKVEKRFFGLWKKRIPDLQAQVHHQRTDPWNT